MKEKIEKILNTNRSTVIWFSCLDKARTIQEIANAWNYSDYTPLHRNKLPNKMVESNFLDIKNIEDRKARYISKLDHYLESFSQSGVEKSDIDSLKKDKDNIIKFMNSEVMRDKFLSLENIKVLCNNDRDNLIKYGYQIPYIIVANLVTIHCFAKEKDLFSKMSKEELISGLFGASGLLNMGFSGLNLAKYYNKVIGSMEEREIEEIVPAHMEETVLYKSAKKQIGRVGSLFS